MSLKFILGTAGSGKTEFCLDEIRNKLKEDPDGSPLILLVPEQATFQLERDLALTEGLGGLMSVQVLSFRRLAWRVFREVGGLSRNQISELGKKMVLKKLLNSRKGELKIFAQATKQPGFLDLLSRNLSEMKRYLVTPAQMSAAANFFENDNQRLLSAKLHDISIIYEEFEKYLLGKFLDPDDYLNLLAQKIPQCKYIQDSSIWIDDFTGFTPQEYQVLEGLFKTARQVNISLCLDVDYLQRPLEDEDCFYITKETYLKINNLCEKLKLTVQETILLPQNKQGVSYRFQESPDLSFLEKNLYARRPLTFQGEISGLHLVAAANRRAEVEGVAREIIKLAREQNYRWRDIAIILRDFEDYQEIIETVFSDYEIPIFMDKKRSVLNHPLIELVISLIEVVLDNWSLESLFRALKTDFFLIDRDEIDRLENYVIAHGIRGNTWLVDNEWCYRRQNTLGEDNEMNYWESKEIALVNKTKKTIQKILIKFYYELKKAETVKEKTTVLFNILEDLKVDITIIKWMDEAKINGNLEEAKEYTQVYDGVIQVFEEIVEILGDEKLSLEEYLQVLKVGLESIQLGLIPLGLDQLMVFSLGRSRIPNVKAVFLLGVVDGIFPKRPVEDSMLTDGERDNLRKIGINTAPGKDRLLIDEEFLVYFALTRASKLLYISFPLADSEGRALMHSVIIDRIKNIFPGLENKIWIQEPSTVENSLEFLSTQKATFPILINQLRQLKDGIKIDSIWYEVYNWFLNNKRNKMDTLKGIFWTNQEEPLLKEIAESMFSRNLHTSVSRLEKFKQCPFAHYLTYGLKLKKRVTHKLEAPDYGEFYHASLKDFFLVLKDKGIQLSQADDTLISQVVDQVVDRLAPKLHNEYLLSSNRYRYITKKLRDIVLRSVLIMSYHAKRSDFVPIGLETSFGFEDSKLKPLEIAVDDKTKIQLRGRIDRIDVASYEDSNYIVVIDYKSGNVSLNLDDLYYGLSLQLIAYLIVCLENSTYFGLKNVKPGGVLYFRVHNPIITMLDDDFDKYQKEVLKCYKMKGLLLGDKNLINLLDKDLQSGWSQIIPIALKKDGGFYQKSPIYLEEWFIYLKEHFKNTIKNIVCEILDGKVSIEPVKKGKVKACIFCDYRAVCQFDSLFAENKYKLLVKFSDEEIWQQIISNAVNGGNENAN